ncbi:MAG: hypothetical protein QOF10_2376 [Kribbellaceae bacterium]|nr:hypothetical protein [Kribbellaceae bacterium]
MTSESSQDRHRGQTSHTHPLRGLAGTGLIATELDAIALLGLPGRLKA